MKNHIKHGLLAATLAIFWLNGTAGDTDSHRQAVEKLFELTQMQHKIETSVDNVVAMQLNQDPAMRQHEALFRDYMERQIGWSALKAPLTDMYMQAFSKQELDDINAFYSSPAGSKLIEKLPELIKRRDQLAMQRMQDNIGELKQAIEAAGSQP